MWPQLVVGCAEAPPANTPSEATLQADQVEPQPTEPLQPDIAPPTTAAADA